MGVYDCIVANIECPNCNKEIRWLEQLNLGYYRMNTYHVGDKIDDCTLTDKWEYKHKCSCGEEMKIIYYIDRGVFNTCAVFNHDYSKKLVYRKRKKVYDSRKVKTKAIEKVI